MENFRPPSNRSASDITFFVTAHLLPGIKLFDDADHARLVVEALQFFRSRHEIDLFGYVVMPNHIHVILRPCDPATVSDIVRRLKSFVARKIGRGSIWGESFWSEVVEGDKSFRQKLQYVHNNPVKGGLTELAEGYPWSSAGDYWKGEFGTRIDNPFGD